MTERALVLQLSIVLVAVLVFTVQTVSRTRALRRVIASADVVERLARGYLVTTHSCPSLDDLRSIGLDDEEAVDPWGSKFHIDCRDRSVHVWSLGADRVLSTDDVRSSSGRHMLPTVLGWPYRGGVVH
jgi:hypothetical protein